MTTTFPQIIQDPDGDTYVLADSEQDALAEAVGNYGEDEIERVEYVGWMSKVAYPEGYDGREEWEQSPNFCESWWEGCQAPVNDKQRAHAKEAWIVVYAA